jgi:hypothetical protein
MRPLRRYVMRTSELRGNSGLMRESGLSSVQFRLRSTGPTKTCVLFQKSCAFDSQIIIRSSYIMKINLGIISKCRITYIHCMYAFRFSYILWTDFDFFNSISNVCGTFHFIRDQSGRIRPRTLRTETNQGSILRVSDRPSHIIGISPQGPIIQFNSTTVYLVLHYPNNTICGLPGDIL